MSSTSSLQGQIESPNPLELFWEKHRKLVLLVITVGIVAMTANYAMQYMDREEKNGLWSGVAVATGLDKGYAEDGSSVFFLEADLQGFDGSSAYLNATRAELITALGKHVQATDPAKLDEALAANQGTPAEPILMWVSAVRAVREKEWDKALTTLADLSKRFPDHFLCTTTDHPIQYQAEVEDDGAEAEAESKPAAEEPELEKAVAGSLVATLTQQVHAQQKFEAASAWLYTAPVPDPKPTVVIKLSTDEEIRIQFFNDKAPKHVAAFLAKVRDAGFYKEQCIDEVHRAGTQSAFGTPAEQFHFGLEASKSDDRSTWTAGKSESSGTVVDFEDNDLSHFPGMVAAAKDSDGKSSGERVWINGNDCAGQFDGDRVVFGRVVGGMDAVERICRNATFLTQEMTDSGKGQLQLYIRIQEIEILDDPNPPEPTKDPKPGEEGGGAEGKGAEGKGESGKPGKKAEEAAGGGLPPGGKEK